MASSRIFVRNLPPTLSDADFRKHFAQQDVVTDAKLLANRRIGYVGYKTPDAAEKAVKYFNKTFIRMSRIGVELARPVDEAPQPRNRKRAPTAALPVADKVSEESRSQAESSLKRKRGVDDAVEADPKLREFLEVMKPATKNKTWANDDMQIDQTAAAEDSNQVEPVHVPEADSDDEYQTVQKKPKHSEATSVAETSDVTTPAAQPSDESLSEDQQAESDAEEPAESGPVSDADWLRSKTSRTLDVVEDDDEELAHRPKPSEKEVSDTAEDAEPESADDTQPPTSGGGAVVDKTESRVSSDIESIRQTGRLFLRNLPYDVSEDDLRGHFDSFGALEEVHVPLDPKTGNGKGFAYVLFEDPENAVRAYEELDGRIFQGRLLHIIPATAKRENKLDEFAISKLPIKQQKRLQQKAQAATATFNWNSLYMNADAVISSVADRLGVSKSDVLDPTSSDAAVKQAHAETHIIQETKAYFSQNGVDLDAFKQKARGDTAILVKNFTYGTKADELKKMFEEHGTVTRFLMPPSGTIAIVEFAQAPQARAAFATLAYRKIKDSILFLEKAPKDLFKAGVTPHDGPTAVASAPEGKAKLVASDLLAAEATPEQIDTSTLYVRNLNFSTTTQRLAEVFRPLDGFVSARVKTKTDPKKPGQILSMGFGFLEFRTKEQAQAALAAMDGYNLDGYKLSIKASNKGLDAAEERRKEDKAKKAAGRQTKIIIKNLPFEATKKDVRALFGAYGQLRSVRVPKKFDASARGFAFADFTTPREAENAMDALRNTHLLGRKLVLDFASEDPEDAEEEIAKMQKKVGTQVNKVALQNLTGAGRKKFNVAGTDELEGA
ncbi:Multiple RNA-binding domain-containing protein 1 [Lasiodiplodia theobromae]|uniref:Multiple RNA-binding domain-containing protein 1 n=1 Tax=Lasiodiplodia theobromae TaxID=45133 RepID=A0A5N5DEJ2_9PEZI|nr:Multiple RNA-binding domain-containing protein 1 [Lasiodiplodia theobromae]